MMTLKNEDMTVGIIGGMGPYATLEFFKCILDNTPAQKDWDHLHIIIDNNPKIPSRTRAFLFDEEDPVPMMIRSAISLQEAGADFVVLPCNSAHYFLPRVREKVDAPFIDMVDQTCEAIVSQQAKVVGLIAGEVTVKGKLYEQRLDQHGISVLQVSDAEQILVRSVIEDVKQNIVSDTTRTNVQRLISALENRGADTVILGCTELPMAVQGITTSCNIVDSLDVLAKAVVQRAKRHTVTSESNPDKCGL
jgi:aspartate racemase